MHPPINRRLVLSESGFTLPELAMVLGVIAILCLISIPQFYVLQNSRRETEMYKVIQSMQAWLDDKKKSSPQQSVPANFPEKLDNQQPKTICQNCFSAGLENPLNNINWYKATDGEYFFSRDGDHSSPEDYQENGDFRIHYEATTGTLTAQQIIR
jgi:prepilin-type N-terminal cleavage/methylation domain-containing protein